MDETGRSARDTARRWLRYAPALIWATGLAMAAVTTPAVRPMAIVFVVAGLTVHLLVRSANRTLPKGAQGARTRRQPLWPDASVKSVVEAVREPALVVDRTLALRYANAGAMRAFGPLVLGDPIAMRVSRARSSGRAGARGRERRGRAGGAERAPADRPVLGHRHPAAASRRRGASPVLPAAPARTTRRRGGWSACAPTSSPMPAMSCARRSPRSPASSRR